MPVPQASRTTLPERAGRLADDLIDTLHPSAPVRPLTAATIYRFAAEVDDPDLLENVVSAAANPDGIGTHELSQRSQCSERQIRYWTEQGYLATLPRHRRSSGIPVLYPPETVAKARIMGSLVSIFGMDPAPAARTAEQLIANGRATVKGFTITRSRFDR